MQAIKPFPYPLAHTNATLNVDLQKNVRTLGLKTKASKRRQLPWDLVAMRGRHSASRLRVTNQHLFFRSEAMPSFLCLELDHGVTSGLGHATWPAGCGCWRKLYLLGARSCDGTKWNTACQGRSRAPDPKRPVEYLTWLHIRAHQKQSPLLSTDNTASSPSSGF